MKKILVVALFVVLAASLASAEVLTTANPVGQGKWAVLGSGLSDNSNGSSMTTIGGYLGYGINDKLDTYFQVGQANASGTAITGVGLNVKYAIVSESASMPVAVAAGAGYKSLSMTGGNGTEMSIGASVSKFLGAFLPYSGLAYRKNTANGADYSSQIDLTVGSAIPMKNVGAFFVEYTLQNISPAAGGSVSGSQIGAGFGATL